MNKILFYILCAFVLCACSEEPYKFYSGFDYIQLDETYQEDKNEFPLSFVYLGSKVTQDTFFMKVFTVGDPKPYRRKVSFEQVNEFKVEYVYDKFGHIVDTIIEEYFNKAIAGTHYIQFDAQEVENSYYIEPDSVSAKLPIILLRDTSLKNGETRLALRLINSSDFKVGDKKALEVTVVFSDQLQRPSKWSMLQPMCYGEYSRRKHEFMIDVAKEKIDDAWIMRLRGEMSEVIYFKDKFKRTLLEHNADPENIAKGLAPMREDQNNPNSPEITFPR